MSIELAKEHFIDLRKKATRAIEFRGLGEQIAKVALVLDISGSMSNLYANGTVQDVVERTLALGIKFDDNQAIDVFLFGVNDYEVGELTEDRFYEYVSREITSKYRLEGSTNYAGVMQRIMDKYTSAGKSKKSPLGKIFGSLIKEKNEAVTIDEPVYVLFVTDGDNHDKEEARRVIREASKRGIFFQFVGVGREPFPFLEELDDLQGRFLDNANFFYAGDIKNYDEQTLFDKLLTEFPGWIEQARSKNLIK
ncbi:VWA domain-containing protein [Paenibacillus sp. FSL R7-0302]|uniref:VWA domain-containing protein n=1 Tax=Paenibacillus sp. FSL R7-0302 TaxID=2921681 RepID=UPI0030FC82BC